MMISFLQLTLSLIDALGFARELKVNFRQSMKKMGRPIVIIEITVDLD